MEILTTILSADLLGKPAWLWLAFVAAVFALLAFDLGVLHRAEREVGVGESLALSTGYVGMGLAFGAWVWWYLGAESGMQYLTGFMIEKTLAMDNVFVIAMVFSYFAVPLRHQHRVLFWGIVGVIVLRAIMIALGAALVERFAWTLYVFGAILVATGLKMLFFAQRDFDVANNAMLRLLRSRLRVVDEAQGNRFWVRLPEADQPGGPPSRSPGRPLVWWATPLFLALALIQFVDLVFAIDSVPAIFAITQDPFIVYTSNIFAILGLRALYFSLAALIHRFRYLKYALAIVLVLIGAKIFAGSLVARLPPWISLSLTFGLLLGGLVYSLYRSTRGSGPASRPGPGSGPRSSAGRGAV